MKPFSIHADIRVLVIRPASGRGIVTKRDQRALDLVPLAGKHKFITIHYLRENREFHYKRLKGLTLKKLTKTMLVTDVPSSCWTNRFKLPETIPGTGVHATKKQLAESFVIGREA